MPNPSRLLTAFARRDTVDKLLFGWVECMLTTLPGVSIQQALAAFAKKYEIAPADFNIESQATRYQRMVKDFYRDQEEAKDERQTPE